MAKVRYQTKRFKADEILWKIVSVANEKQNYVSNKSW